MMIGVAQVIGMNPTLRSFFLDRTGSCKNFGRGLKRQELRKCGKRG